MCVCVCVWGGGGGDRENVKGAGENSDKKSWKENEKSVGTEYYHASSKSSVDAGF